MTLLAKIIITLVFVVFYVLCALVSQLGAWRETRFLTPRRIVWATVYAIAGVWFLLREVWGLSIHIGVAP